jgi:aspartate carbamoyltransferase catalytic subunit
LLSLFNNITVTLISPDELRMPPEIVEQLRRAGHRVVESDNMEQSVSHVDIAYATRIQAERFANAEEAMLYRGRYRLNQAVYTQFFKPNTVIMHPLPRDSRAEANELDIDLNDNPNLAIFRQADNGVLVRMALFALILDVADQIDKYSREVNWYTERRF